MAPEAAYRSTGVAAVITAGGRLDAEFSKSSGVSVKALLRVADETIIERVIRVTKCAESVDRTIVVGPNEVRDIAESSGAEWIIEAGRGGENAVKGALHAGLSHERVIVVASDLPFMESCHLDKFLSSVPEDVSLSVPLIWKQSLETRFPGSVNSFTRVKEGEISPGSLIFVNPKILLQNSVLIDNAFTARKSELRMAKLLGIRRKRPSTPPVEPEMTRSCTFSP